MKNSKTGSEPVAFHVEVRPVADKDIEGLPEDIQERILAKLDELAYNPKPRGSVKLESGKNRYRLRVGIYRIVYCIDKSRKCVTIELIRHRKEIYRHLP